MSFNDEVKEKLQKWRLTTFNVVLVLIFFVFVYRLFSFQIIEGEVWLELSEENRIQEISLPTQRGIITDRNGQVLAQNIASYNLSIVPANLPEDDGEIQEILRDISEYTTTPYTYDENGEEVNLLIQCGDNLGIVEIVEIGSSFSPFQPVFIECDISRERALSIQEKAVDWPGVEITIEPIREYPTGKMTSGIVGYLGPIPANREDDLLDLGFVPSRDKIGYGGLELFFDELLLGLNGKRTVEVDVAGDIIRDIEAVVEPVKGLNLVLTLDTRFQQAAEAIVENEAREWNEFHFPTTGNLRITSGVTIAMDPQTGEILAMVSWPSYENNRFSKFIPSYYFNQLAIDSTNPLLNHAVGAELPAGSVFKIVTGVGALNEGVVTPNQIIKTPPKIIIKNVYTPNNPGLAKEFVDWNDAGFGQLNFYGGVSNSSNVYFYKIGGGFPNEVEPGLGICRLETYSQALGYDDYLGIELPDEANGLIPDPTYKRINLGETWSTGDTYIASVGQGFMLGTPLQVLSSASTIANNGKLMRPTIVKEILDDNGKVVPIVMDDIGNVLPSSVDFQGNIIAEVYDENGTTFDFVVLNSAGELYDYDYMADGIVGGQVYDQFGNPIRPLLISPFVPDVKWDLTEDHVIKNFENPGGIGSCKETGEYSVIEPWVFEAMQVGMRQVVTQGTLNIPQAFETYPIAVAGKTGTAEYCDVVARSKNICEPGNWPTHSWTLAYAPYENPEIVVVSFMYNGGEGAIVAGPVVRQMIDAYFSLKAIDSGKGAP
jgi:penicillin-binding protein 2